MTVPKLRRLFASRQRSRTLQLGYRSEGVLERNLGSAEVSNDSSSGDGYAYDDDVEDYVDAKTSIHSSLIPNVSSESVKDDVSSPTPGTLEASPSSSPSTSQSVAVSASTGPPRPPVDQSPPSTPAAISSASVSVAPSPAATSPAASATSSETTSKTQPKPEDSNAPAGEKKTSDSATAPPRGTPSTSNTATNSEGTTPTPTRTQSHTLPPHFKSATADLPDVPPDFVAKPYVKVTPTSDFAYVTMASGNDAGRMAVALFQSLISTGTDTSKIDLVVLLPNNGVGSPECHNDTWKALRRRKKFKCDGTGSWELLPEEVISPMYVDALRRLGAKLVVHDAIPLTEYTNMIPGGTQTSEF